MKNRDKCDRCGLTARDLPDNVDPGLIFEDGLCRDCANGPELDQD